MFFGGFEIIAVIADDTAAVERNNGARERFAFDALLLQLPPDLRQRRAAPRVPLQHSLQHPPPALIGGGGWHGRAR